MRDSPRRWMSTLEPGSHLACIYENEEDWRSLVGAYVGTGLERNERAVYIANGRDPAPLFHALRREGLDVEAARDSGRFRTLAAEDTYTRGKRFDFQRMIGTLQQETDRALADGHRAIRVAGEMDWVLSGLPGTEQLFEYEALLNDFFRDRPGIGLCQYDRKRFPPSTLLGVVKTHPKLVLGRELVPNPLYIPPEILLSPRAETEQLETWIHSLLEQKHFQDRLYAVKDDLKRQVKERTRELEEMNTAMRVLLEHREAEKRQLQEDVLSNVQKLVLPYIEKMEGQHPVGDQKAYLGIIKSNLQDLVSSFARSLSEGRSALTPTELRVSDLIRHGKTSKEIAALLGVSTNAISVHRHHIRRKLGLLNSKVNLQTHLRGDIPPRPPL